MEKSVLKTTVAVLGASPKPERYSNQAVKLLKEHGYRVIPIHPTLSAIEGLPTANGLDRIGEPVDTLSVYVGPERSRAMIEKIVALNPRRVILNPGTESPELETRLDQAGIRHIKACTLLLLRTGQFEKV
jgi:predicted CoA-binding protein